MKTKTYSSFALTLVTLACAAALSVPAQAQVVASDNADNPAYAPQPTHNWSPINGGFGYDNWTPLSDTGGGGTFMEGVGVNNRQVEGNFSFALYAGGGSFDVSRQLASSITTGTFSIITRFDIAGAGPNVVDLRAGNDLSGYNAGGLLSFGIVNDNQLSYTDSTGTHTLASGEARGDVWDWTVSFDAAAGTYGLTVTNLGGGYAAAVSGNLDASGTSVDSFAVINSSTGNNQNVIFDVPTFTATAAAAPEQTSTLALLGLSMGGVLIFRRRDVFSSKRST